MAFKLEFKSSLTKTSCFCIDESRVSYNEIQFATKDVDGFAYGNIKHDMRFATIIFHHVKIRCKNRLIEFRYSDSILKDTQATMNAMVAALWQYFGNRVMNECIHDISCGRSIDVGGIIINKDGFRIKHKPWFRAEKTYHIRWEHLDSKVNTDWEWLEFKSTTDKKAQGIIGLVGVVNGHVVAAMINELKVNPEMINYLTGRKIYPL